MGWLGKREALGGTRSRLFVRITSRSGVNSLVMREIIPN